VLGFGRFSSVVLRRQTVAELVDVGVVVVRLDVERPEGGVVGYGTNAMAARGKEVVLFESDSALKFANFYILSIFKLFLEVKTQSIIIRQRK
jgi:hypothetical protein